MRTRCPCVEDALIESFAHDCLAGEDPMALQHLKYRGCICLQGHRTHDPNTMLVVRLICTCWYVFESFLSCGSPSHPERFLGVGGPGTRNPRLETGSPGFVRVAGDGFLRSQVFLVSC